MGVDACPSSGPMAVSSDSSRAWLGEAPLLEAWGHVTPRLKKLQKTSCVLLYTVHMGTQRDAKTGLGKWVSPDGWCWWGFAGPGRWRPSYRIVVCCCKALLGGMCLYEAHEARSYGDCQCPEGVELTGASGCKAAMCRRAKRSCPISKPICASLVVKAADYRREKVAVTCVHNRS